MVVMPVSVASTGFGANSYVNFSGQNRRKNNGDTEGSPIEYNRSSNNLAKVPVIVLMAMSPAMMNAKTPITNLSEMEEAKTEIIAPIPIDSEELDEMTTIAPDFSNPQNVQTKAPFGVAELIGRKIYKAETFVSKGQKYYIVYSGRQNSKYVNSVTVFPEGFRNENGKLLPIVHELIYHDLGKGKEFCGVFVSADTVLKNGKVKNVREEIRLPNEVAQNLIDFMAGDTEMKNMSSISYSKTKSSQLRQTKIDIH